MYSRRLFMAAAGAALWIPASARGHAGHQHFTLGVASGSPRETSVILWTRLAPKPLLGGGMEPGAVDVRWRLCSDAAMKRVVREGVAKTSDAKGHSVHVKAEGLEPGRDYFYQFIYGDEESPIGRTKTTDRRAKTAKLALANCQHFETGRFAAYRDLAQWAPDCVIHVGDYMYEGAAATLGERTRTMLGQEFKFQVVRQHDGPETVTLYDYRNRYALYRTDPHLQAAHAVAPWIVAMDDHEVDNNWAADAPQDPEKQTPLEFAVRKIAAFQAFYEHFPMEEPPVLRNLQTRLQQYGAFRFGPAHVSLLDTRQFRSDQACGQGFPGDFLCPAMNDPKLTMTGAEQEAWLLRQFETSDAPFNVIASQTWFAPFQYTDDPKGPRVNMDQWDGYPVQRQRLIDAMSRVKNPVVLSGDWHSAMASTIHKDPMNPKSARVGHNFAATSISSICGWWPALEASKNANPHVSYVDGKQRGYLRCEVDDKRFSAVFRTVLDPINDASVVQTAHDIRVGDI